MTRALLAAFTRPDALKTAAQGSRDTGAPALEAFTPYPIEGLSDLLDQGPTHIPWFMLAGGLITATGFYAMEWFSATHLYVFNQGGRPANSWPAFIVATVEISVLMAALTGFVAFLVKAGLPRLNHPAFDVQAFERASQDQFLLAINLPSAAAEAGAARERLYDAGAVWIEEVEL